jgi:DNA-directed RNA polymerase specialized sigma24 family protein
MTRTTNPLQLLTAELEARSASPSGRRAMERIRADFDLGAVTSMAEMVDQCHDVGPRGSGRAATLADALLAAAANDPDAALCALVALRPALLRIARRVCGGDPDEDELAEVVAIAWEEICGPAGSVGASEVVRVTWTRSRSVLRRQADRASREEPQDTGGDLTEHDSYAEEAEATLATAIADGIVSRHDAAVIALTRLGGMTIAELAIQRGVGVSTLTSRRRRAEAAIQGHLAGEQR